MAAMMPAIKYSMLVDCAKGVAGVVVQFLEETAVVRLGHCDLLGLNELFHFSLDLVKQLRFYLFKPLV